MSKKSILVSVCVLIVVIIAIFVIPSLLFGESHYRSEKLEKVFDFEGMERVCGVGMYSRDYLDSAYWGIYHCSEDDFIMLAKRMELTKYSDKGAVDEFVHSWGKNVEDMKLRYGDLSECSFDLDDNGTLFYVKPLDDRLVTMQYVACLYGDGVLLVGARGMRDDLLNIGEERKADGSFQIKSFQFY